MTVVYLTTILSQYAIINMDGLYFKDNGPKISRAIVCQLVLFVLRVKNSMPLTAFLFLHPQIRMALKASVKAPLKNPETVDRRIKKASNLASVCLLYLGISLNAKIPKDYILLYLFERYYGQLNTPRSPILISPTTAKHFKLRTYKDSRWVQKLYRNKHFLLFPLIYAQLLSNYLTPTQYKLNHRYLSSAIKNWILNPIWRNFHMGRSSKSLNWVGLLLSYAKHNGVLMLYLLLVGFKSQVLAKLDYSKAQPFNKKDVQNLVKQLLISSFNKGNAIGNFIYGTSLLSMLVLTVTLPILTTSGLLQSIYKSHQKNFIKYYIKLIGFASAFTMMLVNLNMSYFRTLYSAEKTAPWLEARNLQPSWFNRINGYLLKLIVLSKWRILKENHPWFTVFRVGTWQRMESVLMCYLMWELMNLNDFVKGNTDPEKAAECRRIQNDSLIRVVDRIMTARR